MARAHPISDALRHGAGVHVKVVDGRAVDANLVRDPELEIFASAPGEGTTSRFARDGLGGQPVTHVPPRRVTEAP